MVAMPGSLLLQLASSTGWLLPSDSMAVALYCWGKPIGALRLGGQLQCCHCGVAHLQLRRASDGLTIEGASGRDGRGAGTHPFPCPQRSCSLLTVAMALSPLLQLTMSVTT